MNFIPTHCSRALLFVVFSASLWSAPMFAQDPDSLTAIQLGIERNGSRIFLNSSESDELRFSRQASGVGSAWYVVPVGQDMVRLQQNQGKRWFALGVDPIGLKDPGPMGPRVRYSTLGQSANQLWRIQQFQGGGYIFENVAVPGLWMTCSANGGLWLQPFSNNPWQVWWPQQPVFTLPVPQYRTLAEQIVPNPALPPTTLRVNNEHSETLMVLLADRRNPGQTNKLRIAAGGSETVTLDRDAGATVIQTVEIMDGFGNWDRQEYQTAVPPSILYDMSVYEEFLQSIAIDRTGKSPNVIEDVNYQPKSVGFFLLPAGEGLPESGAIDAYGAALEANNPGVVRRLSQKDLPRSSSQAPPRDPLRDILDQVQSKRGKF